MRRLAQLAPVVASVLLVAATGCIPYTVGSTAQTVAAGQTTVASSYFFVPNAFKRPEDTLSTPMAGVDREWRHGLDSRSDLGLRLTSGLGGVINYKRRFRDYGDGGPAVAYIVGGGIVNAGLHAHLEGTIVASGDERASAVPFGGVRAMQVFPISAGAVHDLPTLGAFGGVQLGDHGFILRPELGIFYDQSALRVRSGNFIVVPAVTIQRASWNREARVIRRPEMQGSRPDRGARGPGGIGGCRTFGCSTTIGSPRPLP